MRMPTMLTRLSRTTYLLYALTLLVAFAAAPQQAQQGCATPSFSAASQYAAGANAVALATGDFNLDGRRDLAVVNRGANSVTVLLNNGVGFAASSYNTGPNPQQLAAGDFNGDQRLDLVVTSEAAQPVLLLNNGAGAFIAGTALPATGATAAVAAGDFNGDGKLDLATGALAGEVKILPGNGTGGFGAPLGLVVGEGVSALLTSDFNGDGKLDLAALQSDGNGFSILLNQSDGTLGAAVLYTLGIAGASALASGDFNSDGFTDLAITNRTGNRVSVQLNSGAGAFNQAQNFGTASIPDSIAVGDFNGDGKADLAIGTATPEVEIRLGNDTGQFGEAFKFGVGGRSAWATAEDLNSDGRVDVATANTTANNVSVLLNACNAPPSNTPPIITVGAALTRQQGGAGASDTLATVSDAETAAGALQVFVSAAPVGISINNLTNNNGTITAKVAAGCNATPGTQTVTLLVTDGGGLSATANLMIDVTANTPPNLSSYSNATVNAGAGTTVLPAQPPTDNGLLSNITVTASASFTGTVSVNQATGAVTITNAQPVGAHTITVTARDNCNAATMQSFTLTINAGPCVNLRPGLVSWYRGENNSVDFQNNNNAASANGITFTPGRVGQALNFNGSSEVVIPHSASLNFQHFTFEGWVFPTVLDGSVEMLINKEEDPYTTYQYEVGVAGAAGSAPVGTLLFALSGLNGLPSDFGGFVNAGAVLPRNTWTHVALTFNGTTIKSYVNGTVARTITGLSGTLLAAPGPLKLGSRSSTLINQLPQDRFNGLLDEISLYNRALNDQEVANIFNAGSAGKCTVPVNTPPSIQAGAAVTQQQGSGETTVALATVNDVESEPGDLIVTVANAPIGITISKIINTNGAITGNVLAGCNAALGANAVTLRVSDGALSNTATFTINVTANSSPLLGSYTSPGVLKPGESALVTPSAAPSDNGTLASLVASVEGNFTGSVSILPATGVVTLSNVRPAGVHVVNITATDNCGAVTTASFSFEVSKLDVNVTLSATGAPYAQGQPAELTATVTANTMTANPPGGTVTFFDGTTALGTAALNANGQARLTTTALEPGLRALTARYNGDANFAATTSAPLTLNVAFAAAAVSAASFTGNTLAPEQIAAAFGTRLATTRATATTLPLPTTLAGTAVRILDSAGKEALAGLFFVSPAQVNFLMPRGLASGAATITIVASDGISSITRVQLVQVNPGIFTADSSGRGLPAAQVLRVLANGTQVLEQVARFDAATNKFVGVPIDLAGPGEQVFLILYGTGWRSRASPPVASASIGGTSAEITFLAAQPSLLGVDQANVRLPSALLARGEVEVTLSVEGKPANPVRINVK
jgi:uncharacterized protein (TIGR03437 family)